jgi:hypothetical protein
MDAQESKSCSIIFNDTTNFIGTVNEGIFNGSGLNGRKYKGSFRNGKLHGKGFFSRADGFNYEGDFLNGFMTGFGKARWASGNTYEGNYVNGNKEGYGKIIMANKKIGYEGNFKNDNFEGMGKRYDPDTGILTYEGEFVNGKESGMGIEYLADGIYKGQFSNGYYNGKGDFYSKENIIVFSGTWVDGSLREGTEFFKNGTKYIGQFTNGTLKHGRGSLWSKDDKPLESGNWVMGKSPSEQKILAEEKALNDKKRQEINQELISNCNYQIHKKYNINSTDRYGRSKSVEVIGLRFIKISEKYHRYGDNTLLSFIGYLQYKDSSRNLENTPYNFYCIAKNGSILGVEREIN